MNTIATLLNTSTNLENKLMLFIIDINPIDIHISILAVKVNI